MSYHGNVAGIATRFELNRRSSWRLTADLGYALETRAFDSTRPSDKYHYQRDDRLHAGEVGLSSTLRSLPRAPMPVA